MVGLVLEIWLLSFCFLLFLCVESHRMAGMVMAVMPRHWNNVGKWSWHIFLGRRAFGSPWWVPVAQRLLCMVLCYKKDSADSSAAVELSAVAFFTKLGGCSLLTFSVLSSEKKIKKKKKTSLEC